MATAARTPTATPIAPPDQPPATEISNQRNRYRCECGQVLQVFGLGRHRIYFPADSARLDDPVMDGACPHCGRTLPGKNHS